VNGERIVPVTDDMADAMLSLIDRNLAASERASCLHSPELRRYVLSVPCLACNREPGCTACPLCTAIEDAERAVGNPSAQLKETPDA
jgi:hypothetical protein